MGVGYQGSEATLEFVRGYINIYTCPLEKDGGSRLYVYDLIDPMMVRGERGYKGKPLRAFSL